MGRRCQVIVVSLCTLCLTIGITSAPIESLGVFESEISQRAGEDAVLAYETRSPFIVDGNDDFETQNFSGSGTEVDPYVLKNVSINAPSLTSAILITNTDAYFEIRDSFFYSASIALAATAIQVDNVTHGVVRNCTIREITQAVWLDDCENFTIIGCEISNTAHAIRGWTSPWTAIQNNAISDTGESTFYLVLSGNSTITNNTVDTVGINPGIATAYFDFCGNMTLSNNHFYNTTGPCIRVGSSEGSIISNNTALLAGGFLLTVLESNWTIIENNDLHVSGSVGINLQYNHHCQIINNTVSRTAYEGTYARNLTSSCIRNNTIYGTGWEALYLDSYCSNNWIYGNRFGWPSIGRDYGLSGVDIDHWDDAASIGNSWSDYVGPGVKTISGSAGAVDNYPTTLFDLSSPVISSPDNITMAWNQESLINWSVSDEYPYTYELYLEDSLIEQGDWFTGFHIETVAGLAEGLYNYTLSIRDGAGNSVNDTVFVSVEDRTPPDVDSPSDITYEQGMIGYEILWTLGDRNPGLDRVVGNGTTVSDTGWTNGTVSVDVDGFTPGLYNHTMIVTDAYGNDANHTVFVTVQDTTPPEIISPGDFAYKIGTTGHDIVWTIGDINPDQYRIGGNGSSRGWSDWTNGTVSLIIDGYSAGVYNHTILVVDDYGNLRRNTVFVTVSPDIIPPDVDTPSSVDYEEGSLNNEIVWTVGDINPHQYRVVGNGTAIDWTDWVNGTITHDVDGLSPGVYNHTLHIRDAYGNDATSTVLVTVHDTNVPDIITPSDFTYEQGHAGNTIDWVVGDSNPGQYRIDGNATSVDWTSWSNGTIGLDVDGLTPGKHNFTITLSDEFGNQVKSTVFVTVEDTTPPDLISPSAFEYEQGTTPNHVVWTAGDMNPAFYRVDGNGTIVDWTSWSNGTISVDVDGLGYGIYNQTITVTDSYGNREQGTVFVTVTDTTQPALDSPDDIEYELGATGNTISWAPSDMNPSFFEVYRNGTLDDSGPWDGSSIVISVDGLPVGRHNYTLIVGDSLGHVSIDVVIVTVVEFPTTITTTTTSTTTTSGTSTPEEPGVDMPLTYLALILGVPVVVIIAFAVIRLRRS